MRSDLSDLAQRRADLLQRCAQQREQLCREICYIEEQLGGVQRGIQLAQRLTTMPGLLVAGSVFAMLVIAGRGRTLRVISTGLALWASIRRIMAAGSHSLFRQPDLRN